MNTKNGAHTFQGTNTYNRITNINTGGIDVALAQSAFATLPLAKWRLRQMAAATNGTWDTWRLGHLACGTNGI